MGDTPAHIEDHDHYHSSGTGGMGGGLGGFGAGLIGGLFGGLLFGGGWNGRGHGHGGGDHREWADDARYQGIQAQLCDIKGRQNTDEILYKLEKNGDKSEKLDEHFHCLAKECASNSAAYALALCKLENHLDHEFCKTNKHIEKVEAKMEKEFADERLRAKEAEIVKLKEAVKNLESKDALDDLRRSIIAAVRCANKPAETTTG